METLLVQVKNPQAKALLQDLAALNLIAIKPSPADTTREIVAYTSDRKALSLEEYKKRVAVGIEQCMKGESISLEALSKKLGYDYADL
ncbi:MAG: hypothetical protein LBG47_07595 [Prevotellaceae bacterium]|nr:hypothetical protein [Prevotellaceae bacterium]